MKNAELDQGPNLYEYAVNNPVNVVDPSGLCCEKEKKAMDMAAEDARAKCVSFMETGDAACANAAKGDPSTERFVCDAVDAEESRQC